MSISHTFGTVATGTTSVSPAFPSGVPSGARAFLFVVNKTDSSVPTTPSGWDLVQLVAGGAGSNGTNTGKVNSALYVKHDLTAGTEGSTSVTVSISGGNAASAVIFYVTCAAGMGVEYAYDTGVESTSTTSFAITATQGTDFWNTGDEILSLVGTNGNSTFTNEKFTATGETITELFDTQNATGNHLGLLVCSHTATWGGITSTSKTFTGTASAATSGAAIFLRLTETAISPRTVLGTSGVFWLYNDFTGTSGSAVRWLNEYRKSGSKQVWQNGTSTVTTSTTSQGLECAVFTSPNNGEMFTTTSVGTWPPQPNDLIVFMCLRVPSSGSLSAATVVQMINSAGGTPDAEVRASYNSSTQALTFTAVTSNATTSTTLFTSSSITAAPGSWHTVICAWKAAGAVGFTIDGTLLSTATATTVGTGTWATLEAVGIGEDDFGPGQPNFFGSLASVGAAAMKVGTFNSTDVANLHTALKSYIIKITTDTLVQGSFSMPTSLMAFGYSRQLLQGSFSLTGEALALRANHVGALAQGSFALTGETANVRARRAIVAAQGSFALTGETLTFIATHRTILSNGSFTFTGEATAIKATLHTPPLAQGSFSLTGEAATVRGRANVTAAQGSLAMTGEPAAVKAVRAPMALNQGSLAMTGEPANLKAARKITAAQGSFAMTGESASIIRVLANIPFLSGSFSMTGKSVQMTLKANLGTGAFALTGENVTIGRLLANLPLLAGSFAATGEPATIRASRKISGAAGAFALTGESAFLRWLHNVALGSGSFTMAGKTLAGNVTRRIALARGGIAMTGFGADINLSGHLTITCNPGSLAMAGSNATIGARLHGATLAPGAFAMTGEAATAHAQRVVAAQAGAFALTGEDAAVRAQRFIQAQQGSFTITGEALANVLHALLGAGSFSVQGHELTFDLSTTEHPALVIFHALAATEINMYIEGNRDQVFVGNDIMLVVDLKDPYTQEEIDPSDLAVRVIKPDGTIADYIFGQFTKRGTGIYTLRVPVDQPEIWTVVMNSPGPNAKGRAELTFIARSTAADAFFSQ